MSPLEPSVETKWFVIYRGPLSSCNYTCGYCPFAKTKNTREELDRDAECLDRFVAWVRTRKESIGILFTPWGEALIHRHYQRAMVELSHLPHVRRVAAQTNLSFALEWIEDADLGTFALWTTYHPDETSLGRFVEKSNRLARMGAKHSVGVVGRKEAIPAIRSLRSMIDPKIYVWVNAWKRQVDYYTPEEVAVLSEIDPHFHFNLRPHVSQGRTCRSGSEAFTVDGNGDARRCHFIPSVIGNIYDSGFEAALEPRSCSAPECRCHIGYVHLRHLELDSVFGDGILERIPAIFDGPGF